MQKVPTRWALLSAKHTLHFPSTYCPSCCHHLNTVDSIVSRRKPHKIKFQVYWLVLDNDDFITWWPEVWVTSLSDTVSPVSCRTCIILQCLVCRCDVWHPAYSIFHILPCSWLWQQHGLWCIPLGHALQHCSNISAVVLCCSQCHCRGHHHLNTCYAMRK